MWRPSATKAATLPHGSPVSTSLAVEHEAYRLPPLGPSANPSSLYART